jgi:hypothetical protein
MNTTPNVHAEAAVIAADSYTNNFSSRRGTGLIGLGQCRKGSFYLYDNNPYGKDKLRPLDADGTRRLRPEHC